MEDVVLIFERQLMADKYSIYLFILFKGLDGRCRGCMAVVSMVHHEFKLNMNFDRGYRNYIA